MMRWTVALPPAPWSVSPWSEAWASTLYAVPCGAWPGWDCSCSQDTSMPMWSSISLSRRDDLRRMPRGA